MLARIDADLGQYAAVNARVRTLLPALLGRTGLEALAGYPTLDALQAALAQSPYAAQDATAARDRLAQVARRVLALVVDPGRSFLRAYLLHHEVENLKIVIRAVYAGLPWPRVARYLLHLPDIETLDMKALAAARDLSELGARLGTTVYGPAFRGALHRAASTGPFAVEVALELDHYDRLWASIGTLRPSDAVWARQLLGVLFDILNLSWIARYALTLQLRPEETLNYTLRQGRWLTLEMRRRLAENPTQPWDALLLGTPYAAALVDVPPRTFDSASPALWRILGHEIQRALTGYPFHIGVPLGFLLAQEIELQDLAGLIAAKRLGRRPDDIIERIAGVRA